MSPQTSPRFAQAAGDSLQWRFKRNCSITPRQLGFAYLLLSAMSLAVAGYFWFIGVRWILFFTGVELAALALAFAVCARHATNRESIELGPERLVIEQEVAGRVQQVVFNRQRARVAARRSPTQLIEVCEGQRCVCCGHHIRPHWREQVAREIRMALQGF
jgi:uncharacterized membrane protein